MNLLSRFFRPAAPTPPPTKTLEQRIEDLSAGSPDLIRRTALGAGDEALRTAAIQQLPDGADLRMLAGLSAQAGRPAPGPPTELAAQARLARLIDSGSIDLNEFCGQIVDRSLLFAVVARCQSPGPLTRALSSISDPAVIGGLVTGSPSSRLRQLAAERIDDPEQLKELVKQVRNKDKNVYKILKQKCDVLAAQERSAAQRVAAAVDLCASLERHGSRSHDASYAATLERLRQQWCALPTPPQELEQRVQRAIEHGRSVIAAHAQQVAEQAERRAAELTAEAAARDLRARAMQAAEEVAAVQSDAETRQRLEAAAATEAEHRARAERRAAEDQAYRQVDGLIRRANGALAEGDTKRAAGIRRALDEKLTTAPILPPHLARHLQQLDDKLNELKQWKDYAVAPKRIELIEEMESLIGSEQEAKALAERIKGLQQEWRTISQGIVSEAPAEWERFHQASQTAYQPCRVYFEAQTKLRQENLEGRKTILERLQAVEARHDEESPDWRLLTGVLREAPLEWRRYAPVDRDAGRAAQVEFDASMTRLHSKLDAWFAGNVQDKQSLITQARALLTQEDSREAIDAVKRLQLAWKASGPAPRDQDRSLWSEFRELCDAVFARRQQAYSDYAAGLEANKLKALALCEEAERIAASSGSALIEGAARIAQWRADFEALGEMPRADARAIQARFERAVELSHTQRARQLARDAQQSFADLFQAARRVRAYAWAVATHAEEDEQGKLKENAERFMASVAHWPKGGQPAIEQALASAGAIAAADQDIREKALRTLCIRCEIYSETPTPPEDEALRRAYQVQRLMDGLGQGVRADKVSSEALALEWVGLGGVSPLVQARLEERFMRCWERIATAV